MRKKITFCLVACILSVSTSEAGPVRIPGVGGTFTVPVSSLNETRWKAVVAQQYDYSCGSAAVATLLTYHYNRPTPETTVFQQMFRSGDQAKIQAEGFSMLDMKRYLDSRGLKSDGFRVSLDKFAEIGVPGITLVNTKGYRHFVVVKGIDGDRILIGDPAIGTRVIPRKLFESLWNGAVLAARGDIDTARANFNLIRDWRVRPRAPIRNATGTDSVGMFTLTMPGFGLPSRGEIGR